MKTFRPSSAIMNGVLQTFRVKKNAASLFKRLSPAAVYSTSPSTPPTWLLFEDNHLIVCNKPSGVLAQGDSTGDVTMIDQCKQYLAAARGKNPSTVFLGLVHRIDRVTSGVIVYAKTSKAAARLSADFRDRLVKKHYMCVVNVCGPAQPSSLPATLEHLLDSSTAIPVTATRSTGTGGVNINTDEGRSGSGKAKNKTVVVYGSGGKVAELQYQRIDVDPPLPVSDNRKPPQALLLVQPSTGRKHQIRCQMSHMGWPIVGDYKYAAPQRFKDTRDIALHALVLQVRHPVQRERNMRFSAPLPAMWRTRFGSGVDSAAQVVIERERESGEMRER